MIRLTDIILEGRYDRIVGKVNKALFKSIKDAISSSGTEEDPKPYKGYQVRKEPMGMDISDLFQLERRDIYVGEFQDDKAGLEFEVQLKFALTRKGVAKGKFFIDGSAETDEDYPVINVELAIHPDDGVRILSKIQPIFRDLVRHEIEHLTHGRHSLGSKISKWMRGDLAAREKIRKNPELYHKYFLLPKEVDANIHGLYSKAKTIKKPYQQVVDDYLDELVKDGIISKEQRKQIYNKWKKRIPKIGGLPKLK